MPSERRRWKFRLRHVIDAIQAIENYTRGMDYAQFGRDSRTVDAVVWKLTVIGEAARHVPQEVESAYPAVPWAKMRGMRNQIVHGYDKVDLETVWKVVQEHLPGIVPLLEAVLAQATE
ncbi:MAG: DUF86 domain-containing protein [Planctomycetota bacterium]